MKSLNQSREPGLPNSLISQLLWHVQCW